MQQFTFRTAMTQLGSSRVKAALASAVFFGATGALRGACARLESYTRTIKNIETRYPERAEKMRTAPTMKDLDKRAEQAASRAAAIHAIAEEHGVMIRLEFEPPVPQALNKDQIAKLAEITRIDAKVIEEHRQKSNDRRYAEEMEAADIAASLFWTAVADSDALIKFEAVQKAIDRTRLNLLGWSTPDFAELALVASDELALADWEQLMSDDPAQFQEDDDAVEERHRRSEIAALDAHARTAQNLAYLDAERKKASKPKRTRVAKPKTLIAVDPAA